MIGSTEKVHRVGVIGLGGMGRYHANCYLKIPSSRLVAVAEVDKGLLESFSPEINIKHYSDPHELMRDPTIDAVDICTPTFTHAELSMSAAGAGKHILCEKPLARTLQEGLRVVQTAKETGVTMMVPFVLRFMHPYRLIRETVKSDRLGRIGVARTSRCGAAPRRAWYTDFQKSGGVALDLIIHDIDFLVWCLGKVERVFAKGLLFARGSDLDYALVTLRFKSGALAHIEGSWAEASGFYSSIEVAGSEGVIEYGSRNATTLKTSRKSEDPVEALPSASAASSYDPVLEEIKHFLLCIEGREKPAVGPEEAFESLKVSLAAIQSIKSGKAVSPDDVRIEDG